MKNLLHVSIKILIVPLMIFLVHMSGYAQGFQRLYGNEFGNAGWKVIPNGSNYYVIGSNQVSSGGLDRGSISYINSAGEWIWQRGLNVASVLMDGVLTPSGDLLFVGSTLPSGESSAGIIGSINTDGTINWLNTYDQPGKDEMWLIKRSANPENFEFPYVVAGLQADDPGNPEAVNGTLLTMNESGAFNWKKVSHTPGDSKSTHAMEILSNGDIFLAGSWELGGTVQWLNNAGEQITAAAVDLNGFAFKDIAPASSGGFYLVGGNSSDFYLTKLTEEFINAFDVKLEGLTDVSQVWEDESTGTIDVVGRMNIGGAQRAIVMNFTDDGNGITQNWVRYLDNGETSYSGGSIWFLPPDWLGYTDGRTDPDGFGGFDMFLSLSDLALTTCMTVEVATDVTPETWLYNGPNVAPFTFWDVPSPTPLSSTLVTWEQQDVCTSDSCFAEFEFGIDCGEVSFFDLSTIPFTPSWSWTFESGSPATSTLQNPVVNFPGCGTYEVCLTITGSNGTSACSHMICKDVFIDDNIPPVVECSGVSVELDANCEAIITPATVGFATDNCLVQSTTISPNVITNCGFTLVTFTATDWCGNVSTCSTSVFALEIEPPVVTCRPNITVTGNGPAPCTAVVNNLSYLTATDNCELVDVSYIITGATSGSGQDASGTTFNQGVSNILYTATDACGNTDTCSFTVTVNCNMNAEINWACGMTVVTCFSGMTQPWPGPFTSIQNAPVIALFDTRDLGSAIPGNNWTSPTPPPKQMFQQGDAASIGQVFGLAIDNAGSIFTTASTIYGDGSNIPGFAWGPLGPGGIYRFTYIGGQWVKTDFAKIPNSGSGLGNITYDKINNQFFVTNFQDGLIYRIPNPAYPTNAGTGPFTTYNPTGTTITSSTHPNFVPLGERVWGIGYNAKDQRLYYARWNEDEGRQSGSLQNDIYSVAVNAIGIISGTELPELQVPSWNSVYSNPVSDIEFSDDGDMVIAEKVMFQDIGYVTAPNPGAYAHRARVIQYTGTHQNWGAPQEIFIGNVTTNQNSAGGVDYAYEDIDNGSLIGCDSIIVGTGDALMWPNFNANPANQDLVYGMAFMPVSGNSQSMSNPLWVKSTSVYLDLDGNVTNLEKLQIGDVDVFNCPCPGPDDINCDSMNVSWDPVPMPGEDKCCYEVDFDNNSGSITKVCAKLTTPDWIFNTGSLQLSNPYTWAGNGQTQLCFEYQGGNNFPTGNLQNLLTFCLAQTSPSAPPTQQIIFEWYNVDHVLCYDTLVATCGIITPDTCNIISDLEAICDGENDLEYCVTFNITNISNLPAYGVILEGLPFGYTFDDCGCGGNIYNTSDWLFSLLSNPILPNTTRALCVKIRTILPILKPTDVCFNSSLLMGSECCSSVKDWCVTLKPCCDPCESTTVTVNEQDSCCYSLDLDYQCDFGVYSRIDFTILTNGVYFGYHGTPWYSCSSPGTTNTTTYVCVEPTPDPLPSGSYQGFFDFCLTDVNMPSEVPQQILVNFYTHGTFGQDSLVCDTILELNCESNTDTCVFLTEETIRCIPDSQKYEITVNVQNVSNPNFTGYYLMMLGNGISPNPIVFNPPLQTGDQQTVTFCYTPSVWPDPTGMLILSYNLKSITGDTCCNGNQTFIDTLILPPCEPCHCPDTSFTDLFLRGGGGIGAPSIPIQCYTSYENIGCPDQGFGLTLTGLFNCEGDTCFSEPYVYWSLEGPAGTTTQNGSAAGPFFGINMPPSYFTQPGIYTMSLTGFCNYDTCSCEFQFVVDCPSQCPCEEIDRADFDDRASQGFSQWHFGTTCEGCFSPNALNDCEQVDWVLGNGTYLGSSNGNQIFCHDFGQPGTYDILMFITRLNSDGTVCDTAIFMKTITLTCIPTPDVCSDEVLRNPDFSDGAIEGGLNSGGASSNWLAPWGDPHVLEGDGGNWFIRLRGNLEVSDVLEHSPAKCMKREETVLSLRMKADMRPRPGRPCDIMKADWTDENGTVLKSIRIPLTEISSTEWTEVEIPLELTDIELWEVCGDASDGLRPRLSLSVWNALTYEQGGEESFSVVDIDQICLRGNLVATIDIDLLKELKIYPNPNEGEFTVELPEINSGMTLRVLSLTGKEVMRKEAEAGKINQTIDVKYLPQGMYFLQVISDDQVISVNKFVKQ